MPKRYRDDSLVIDDGRPTGGWEVRRVFWGSLFELYRLSGYMRCSSYIVYLINIVYLVIIVGRGASFI